MEFKELLKQYNLTITEFSRKFEIPFRSAQNWYSGVRKPPDYLIKLIQYKLERECE
jgi:DNA-binding transcriptional regulator YiaG